MLLPISGCTNMADTMLALRCILHLTLTGNQTLTLVLTQP